MCWRAATTADAVPHQSHETWYHESGAMLVLLHYLSIYRTHSPWDGERWRWELWVNQCSGWAYTTIMESRRRPPAPYSAAEFALADKPF